MNKPTYVPLGNAVVVEAVAVSTTIKLPGNLSTTIKLPGNYEPYSYTVVGIGDGKLISKKLKVGDSVVLNPGASFVKIKDTNYAITNAENVLAVISVK